MTSKEHKKHTHIPGPSFGFFGRNEWAIVGGQCNDIRQLAEKVMQHLSPNYTCGYSDAKHHEEVKNTPGFHKANADILYTNNINYHQFDFSKEFNSFQYRQIFNDADIILVNGNHFEAKNQVVIIDETKKASLQKRISRLTNVELFLLAENADGIFDFIQESIPSCNEIPVLQLQETGKIIDFFRNKMLEAKPVLNGLVLAGGKSIRMGHDKGLIKWHGKEQQYYLADLLKMICDEVYISCRPDQKINENYKTLPDTFIGLGPFGAILSAFREMPEKAWLVTACDLPLLDLETLQFLQDQRKSSSMATAYESPYNHFPEPLTAIWEPKSYLVLLSFLSQGYNCPVKALRNMDTHIVKINREEKLTNVNTREEFEKVQQLLQKKLQEGHAS